MEKTGEVGIAKGMNAPVARPRMVTRCREQTHSRNSAAKPGMMTQKMSMETYRNSAVLRNAGHSAAPGMSDERIATPRMVTQNFSKTQIPRIVLSRVLQNLEV